MLPAVRLAVLGCHCALAAVLDTTERPVTVGRTVGPFGSGWDGLGEVGRVDVHLITADSIKNCSVEELPALLERKEGLVWVDIPSCDEEAVHVPSEVFTFHPMAVRDCVERNRVPKVHVVRRRSCR